MLPHRPAFGHGDTRPVASTGMGANQHADQPPPFTCPACGKVSRHPEDGRNGYCGACHAFTSGAPTACSCLCAAAHPEAGICTGWAESTVTVDASRSVLAELEPGTGTVTVQTCRACSEAQRAHNPRIVG